jgi:hypothetical protein
MEGKLCFTDEDARQKVFDKEMAWLTSMCRILAQNQKARPQTRYERARTYAARRWNSSL